MADKARIQRSIQSISRAAHSATPKLWLSVIAGAAAVAGLARPAHATVTIDGTLDSDYGTPAVGPNGPAVQTNNSGFGDNTDTSSLTGTGSELDAAYGVVQGGNLDLFFAGNLETNFNHLNIFIANGIQPGQTTLSAQGTLGAMNGSKFSFSAGYGATYALDINGGGSPLTWYINKNDLTQSNGPSSFLGQFSPTAAGSSAVVGGITFSFNNSNIGGVAGSAHGEVPEAATGTPAAVNTGFEMAIPLSTLGISQAGGTLEVLADINGGSDGYLSNQFLPALPTASANLGWRTGDDVTPPTGATQSPYALGTSRGAFDFSSTPGMYFTVVAPGVGVNGVWTALAGGNWGTPGNWSSNPNIPSNPSDTATFGPAPTGASIVTLDSSRTVGQITFNNTNGYTIALPTLNPGGKTLTINDTGDTSGVNPLITVIAGHHFINVPVTLANGVTMTTAGGTILTIGGAISGSGGLTTSGGGTVALTAANNYAGNILILGGTLELDNNSAASSSVINLGDSTADGEVATLSVGTAGLNILNSIQTNHDDSGMDNVRLIATTFASGTATFSGPLTLNGGALLSANVGTTLVYSGAISDGTDTSGDAKFDVLANSNGSLGTVVLPNANTYAGITAVDAGTLVLGNSTAASGGNIFVGNGGGGFANTNAALLANTAGLNIANPIITNKADNGTSLGTGTRTIGGTNTTGTVTYSGGVNLNGGATLAAAAGGTVNFSSPIADGTDTGNVSHAITISGPGTIVFSAVNTYSGPTLVNAGALNVAAGGALPTTTDLTVGDGTDKAQVNLPAAAPAAGIQAITLDSITMQQNGALTVATPDVHADRSVIVTNNLTFNGTNNSWQGLIDMNTNDMIVHAAGSATLFPNITNQIKEGFNGGTWTGTAGITSTALKAAVAAHPGANTSLGVELNDDGTNTGTALVSTFDGQPTVDGDVLVKYTYFGDANLDGVVNASDYMLIDNGFNTRNSVTPLTGWQNGDFNYDGVINGDDYTLIDNAFNTQGGVSLALAGSPLAVNTSQIASVPEPASLGLIAIGAVGLLNRRRRRI